MIDIDETIRRLYANPYEAVEKPEECCKICGEKIYADGDRYRLLGIVICNSCVANSKE